MHRLRLKIAVTFILVLFLLPRPVYSQESVRTVVFFCSWNASTPAYQYIIEGFKTAFSEDTGQTYNLLTEYLDISRDDNMAYAQNIIAIYNEKYKEIPFDLIISIGPSFLQVLQTLGLEALESTPVITIFNEQLDDDLGGYTAYDNLLSINFHFDFHKTIQTAIELFPKNKNFYVISGNSAVDDYFSKVVRNDIRPFSDTHSFIFVSGISIDSTLRLVEQIPKNNIVLVVNFNMDINKIPFSTPEVIGMISNSTDAPVFMLWDAFRTKKGGIGGYVFSYYNVGKEVGKAAREILNGKPAQDISINQDSFYLYVYDWQELKKWGLTNSKAVPDDSEFYYYDPTFLAENKWYALGLILFLVGETLLIMFLFRLNKRQKQITERNLETEKMYRELMREDRFSKMTELTASLSHELNQPLTAILFSAQAGKRFLQSGKLDKEQAGQILDNIIEDDKRAGAIISSVRSLMKIEHREKEKTDINSLVRETVELVRNDAIRQKVKIVLTPEADRIFVLADKIQLQQVILNFIRNSEIAMENNDPDNKRLEILTSIDKGYVTVSIRDSGPGINSAIIDKIFKPFVTDRKGGSGIGLALSRSIIEAHNGSIWAENITGGGAVFSFRLPILKNE